MQRIGKIQELQASENSHQGWFMFYALFMFDEIGELANFMKFKLFGTVCVICALFVNIFIRNRSIITTTSTKNTSSLHDAYQNIHSVYRN